jgi:hypothetical protein
VVRRKQLQIKGVTGAVGDPHRASTDRRGFDQALGEFVHDVVQAMAKKPVPQIVPCRRVTAAVARSEASQLQTDRSRKLLCQGVTISGEAPKRFLTLKSPDCRESGRQAPKAAMDVHLDQ